MSAVVVNYNGGRDLIRCLDSLALQTGVHEIIVIDNDSRDDSVGEARRSHPGARFISRAVNDGFGGAANVGAAHASGDYLLFLNPDVILDAGCVAALVRGLERRPGVAGPVLRVEASASVEYGATVDVLGMPHGLMKPATPLYVPGCSLATDTRVFRELGGFDPRYFLFVEDTEYCWRTILAGYDVSICEDAMAWHRGGGSTPGGYAVGSEVTTTDLRVQLRERNGLAMFIACAPARWLPLLVSVHILKTIGVALGASILLRRPLLSRSLFDGLAWNARQLPGTIARRRSLPRSRTDDRRAFRLVARRSNMLRLLRRYGLPRFLDDRSPADTAR